MNEEHLREWVHELRTTSAPQANDMLATRLYGPGREHVAYCCLGIGCTLVPELRGSVYVDPDRLKVLPPVEFIDWLGIDSQQPSQPRNNEWMVVLDYPLPVLGTEPQWGVTADWLNDSARLTFSQIADMLEYFGIKEAVQF